MVNVQLEYFSNPITHREVTDVVYRMKLEGDAFDLGFLPESELIYHFDASPDVYFRNLPIREVYCEPSGTFLRLSRATNIEVQTEGPNRLFVRGIS